MNLSGGSKAVLLHEASALCSCQLPKENSTSFVIWNLPFWIKVATSAGPRMHGEGTVASAVTAGGESEGFICHRRVKKEDSCLPGLGCSYCLVFRAGMRLRDDEG